jgi:hypothetical protein
LLATSAEMRQLWHADAEQETPVTIVDE